MKFLSVILFLPVVLAHAANYEPGTTETSCEAQVTAPRRPSQELSPIAPIQPLAIVTKFQANLQALLTVDIDNVGEFRKATDFFQAYGREVLSQIYRDTELLDAYQVELETSNKSVDEVTTNIFELGQKIQENLDPVTLKRIKDSLIGGDTESVQRGIRQIISRWAPKTARKAITYKQEYRDIADVIKRQMELCEEGRLEVIHIQAHLRQVRGALENLEAAGRMVLPEFKNQLGAISDPKRKAALLLISDRFEKTLTQITKGATLATDMEQIFAINENNFYDAYEKGEDAIMITLPAHKMVDVATIAQARARNLSQASESLENATIAAFSALSKKLLNDEVKRQTHEKVWLTKTVDSFEEVTTELIKVADSRRAHAKIFGEQMRVAREKMMASRQRLDEAAIK